jgi:purine nucleosidase
MRASTIVTSEKILLDTDIGSDVDDAVCLAYLLANPNCELLGITTVTGEAEERARLASVMCQAAGKLVPIFPGAEQPLVVPQKQVTAPQAVALQKWGHEKKFPRGEAVQFLRETIRTHPSEVTLLAIGPLTNIGLLFAADPEIPSLLRGLVMMCGRFSDKVQGNYGAVEWNAGGDPHATAIVYRAEVPVHRSVGLDVTSRVTMDAEQFTKTFGRFELFRPVLDFAEIWFKDWKGVTFHDPLAAATIFDERICTFQSGSVEVDLTTPELQGALRWTPGTPAGKHQVAVDVDEHRFFEHFLSVFE